METQFFFAVKGDEHRYGDQAAGLPWKTGAVQISPQA